MRFVLGLILFASTLCHAARVNICDQILGAPVLGWTKHDRIWDFVAEVQVDRRKYHVVFERMWNSGIFVRTIY